MTRQQWLGVGLGVLALAYLSRPGRTVAVAAQDGGALLSGSLKLTATQDTYRRQIESAFAAQGMAWAGPAAVANAWAESALDPLAAGDNGHSIGLFQLNDGVHAAGAGMTVADRQDPAKNIARIIEVCRGSTSFMATRGTTHENVTRAFAKYIEVCATCSTEATQALRVRYLTSIYGLPKAAEVAA